MCGGNCASRPETASSSSRMVSRRKGNFQVASILVADIPHSYSFYSPVMSDDSGRNSPQEIAGSTGDKKSTPLGESGTTGCGERKIPQPETLAESDTSDHRSRSGSVQTTTNGRLDNADFGLSALLSNRERFARMHTWSGWRVCHGSPLESKDQTNSRRSMWARQFGPCKTQCRRSEQHGSAAECSCVDRKNRW